MMRSSVRSSGFFVLFLVAAFVLPLVGFGPAVAEEDAKKKEKPIPPLASDEEAAEALKAFKVDFKAKGLKGEEKIGAKAWALTTLSKVQHPKVVDEIAKHTKNRNADLRTGAVLALGNQRRIPGYAGKAVVVALKRHGKDATFVMASLESIGKLRYFGAKQQLAELMKHHEYAVVKNALVTIGRLNDARFIADIVKLMKELKLEKGAKWDGVNVTYDTGTAGDHDQKMAEKIGKAQEAKNKKKGKRAAKSMRDLGPIVLEVMYDLTGERFTGGIEARKWLDKNRADVDKKVAAAKKVADDQAKEATELKKKR
ncbi:MAG: hypothetical protein QNJ90_03415 [Planctomycetota bacterium]|nr:hypothetical protein [Planctomycetota bacterium]